MHNEELHAESSLDTVWVIIYKDGEVVRIGNKHGRESLKKKTLIGKPDGK
jgi:hypothetical protein